MKPKLVIAIVLFAAAGLIAFLNSGNAEELPDETPGIATPFQCINCNKRVDLKDPAFFAALEAVGNEMPLNCDGCSKRDVYRLFFCIKCDTGFFGTEAPGGPGKCPKCNPKIVGDDMPVTEGRKRPKALSF